ncbi:hypothetical protein [Salinicola halophyticus]|uniref:hypothetical protein n=1 Tax=Salinicola halophyticus TaxID=1808881 RepID=UPI000DA1C350|nr:hypothetical protein [Salinicola halophyticus]
MNHKIIVACFMIIPNFSYGASPEQDVSKILSANSKDEKCELFFKSYINHASKEDYDGADKIIELIDKKDGDLVDYCDKNRSKFI